MSHQLHPVLEALSNVASFPLFMKVQAGSCLSLRCSPSYPKIHGVSNASKQQQRTKTKALKPQVLVKKGYLLAGFLVNSSGCV